MFFNSWDGVNIGQEEKIKNHKYSRTGSSLMEPYLYSWWEFAIKCTPKSISPNMITLIGFLFMLSSTLSIIYYSPKMDGNVPGWVHLYACFCIFVYQTLDAIDGKQARRLKLSSTLGEFFDHGCDAIVVFLICINIGCATSAGRDIIYFQYAYWSLFLNLYCTHWGYYVTGSFEFTTINVTEGQLGAIFIHFISIFIDSTTYHTEIINGWTGYQIVTVIWTVLNMSSVPFYIFTITNGGKGKNGSSVANTSIASPLIPFLTLFLTVLYINQNSRSDIGFRYPVESLTIIGLIAATLSTKLLLSTILEVPFPLLDITLVNTTILAIVVKYGTVVMEIVALYSALIVMVMFYLMYFYEACLFMSKILNIPILRLPKKIKLH